MNTLKKFLQKKHTVYPNDEQLVLIVSLSFDDPYFWKLFSTLAEGYGSWDKIAYDTMKTKVENGGKEELLFHFGFLYLELELYENSIDVWRTYLRIYPKSYNAQYNMGLAYQNSGGYPKAIEVYDHLLDIYPAEIDTYLALADTYSAMGEYEKAIEKYQVILRLDTKHYASCVNIANLYKQLKQNEQAITYYQRAIDMEPEYKNNYFWYIRIGNLCKDRDELKKVL